MLWTFPGFYPVPQPKFKAKCSRVIILLIFCNFSRKLMNEWMNNAKIMWNFAKP